jgi:hypothetical protein
MSNFNKICGSVYGIYGKAHLRAYENYILLGNNATKKFNCPNKY